MARLAEVYVATRTRNVDDAGTSDEPILLLSRGSQDLFQVPLDTDRDGLGKGKAALFKIDVTAQALDSEDLDLRLVASGNNAWAPEHVVAWGVTSRFDGLQVVPLGALIDLATPQTEDSGGTWLSSDDTEGVISLALRPVGWGSPQTRALRIIAIVATSQYVGFPVAGPGPGGDFSDTGTDADVALQAGAPGRLLLHYRFPNTPQEDLERSGANFYMTSVPGPFSRADVEGGSFVLSIAGGDWWVPVYVGIFGLDTPFGQPTALIPFVHAETISLPQMSSDPSEGWEDNRLPTAQVPSDSLVAISPSVIAALAARVRARSEDRRPGPHVPVVRIRGRDPADRK